VKVYTMHFHPRTSPHDPSDGHTTRVERFESQCNDDSAIVSGF
jgi:hypothetical protein